MGLPRGVADVQAVVASSALVRGVGLGHSWRSDLFCAGGASRPTLAPVARAVAAPAHSRHPASPSFRWSRPFSDRAGAQPLPLRSTW